MFKNKPITLLIAACLLVVLILLTLVFQFAGQPAQLGMAGGRPGGIQGNFQPGQMPEGAARPDGGQPPSGSGDFLPPSGSDSSFSGTRPDFNNNSTSMKLMQLLRGVQIGASILIALLGILSLIGILLSKAWGRKWAIVTAILSLLALIPSFFQMRFGSNLIVTLVKLALVIAVLVLCFLPKSKQAAAEA